MVIAMPIAPDYPFGLRQVAENWMRLKGERRVGELLYRTQQLLPILPKLYGRRAADFLIHLWSCLDALGPGERGLQRQPFHQD